MSLMDGRKAGYFLPDDWILWQSEGRLEAIQLSSGEQIRIECGTEAGALTDRLSASVWDSLARFEPLVGQLRARLREQPLQPLTRQAVLRGSGWRQLFVELTSKCNEQCVHCYAESSPHRVEALSWPELQGVLEDAKALGFGLVQLTGGDPLVSPHCLPAVELGRTLGIPQIEIYTNGLALRGTTYDRLRALRPSFAFSFYSHDPQTHDAITQTAGSHARTTRAIRRAVRDGLQVRVGMIAMEQNRGHASRARAYLQSLGVAPSAIRIDRMRDVGRGHPMQWDDADDTAGMRAGGVESAKPRNFGGTAAVSYDGNVHPCIFSRHLLLGSIRKQSLEAILTSVEAVVPAKRKLLSAAQQWEQKLACWECRARSALLDGSYHA